MIDPDGCRLACPVCGAPLGAAGGSARCATGHSFDFARSGYLNLGRGGGPARVGDSAEMVRARAAFLAAGHYEPLAAALVRAAVEVTEGGGTEGAAGRPGAAAPGEPGPGAGRAGTAGGGAVTPGVLCELGSGTGYYLGAVACALAAANHPAPAAVGIDLAKAAAERAARDHPEAGFVVADVEAGLPLLDASVALCLSVFAPRPAAELGRVLRPGGALLVALAGPSHLERLRRRAGLIAVGADKLERLGERLGPWFDPLATSAVEFPLRLSEEDARNLVLMGPSARHAPDLAALAGGLEDRASVTLAPYRRRPDRAVH